MMLFFVVILSALICWSLARLWFAFGSPMVCVFVVFFASPGKFERLTFVTFYARFPFSDLLHVFSSYLDFSSPWGKLFNGLLSYYLHVLFDNS